MAKTLEGVLKKGVELVKKLDKERWKDFKPTEKYYMDREKFTSEERILIHWITYITDRIIKARIVWTDLHNVFSFWIKEYLKDRSIDSLFDKNRGFVGPNREYKKSAYWHEDFKCIKRTFEILKNYNKSLVKFILDQLERFGETEKNIVRKIACALFLLSYDSVNKDDVLKILTNKNKFETYYSEWEKRSRIGKKRLWAAFRDYIRIGSYWREDFLEALKKLEVEEKYIILWKRFGEDFHYLNQLELPGDIWNANEEFAKTFLRPLAMGIGILLPKKITPQNVPELVRKICTKLQEEYNEQIFPEQFDFVWGGELLEKFLAEYKGSSLKKFIKT